MTRPEALHDLPLGLAADRGGASASRSVCHSISSRPSRPRAVAFPLASTQPRAAGPGPPTIRPQSSPGWQRPPAVRCRWRRNDTSASHGSQGACRSASAGAAGSALSSGAASPAGPAGKRARRRSRASRERCQGAGRRAQLNIMCIIGVPNGLARPVVSPRRSSLERFSRRLGMRGCPRRCAQGHRRRDDAAVSPAMAWADWT